MASRTRYRAKVDDNQKEIVELLEKRGFAVLPLHTVGGGLSDLLVGTLTDLCLVEVKNGKRGTYTKAQKKFKEQWRGKPSKTIRTIEDALKFEVK